MQPTSPIARSRLSANRTSVGQRLLSSWFRRPAIWSLLFLSTMTAVALVVHATNTEYDLIQPSETASLLANANRINDHDVMITAPVANTISGTLFDSSGAPITTGRTIQLLQNGNLGGVALSDGLGVYTFTGLTLASGDRIVVYISGSAEKGATFTFTSTSDIPTLNIYQNQLVVRSDNGSTVTNADLKSAQGLSPDADLLDVQDIDQSNTLTTPSGFTLQIWSGTTYAPGADIHDGGNWINNGTFIGDTFTVNFNGANNQTINGLNSTTFNNLMIANTGDPNIPSNIVSLDGSAGATNTAAATLTVSIGVFDQGSGSASSNLSLTGTGDVATVTSNGTWQNFGTGDITLNGDVINNGFLEINANGKPCGQSDDILIRSAGGTQRTWKGTGTFSMTDVDVQDQKVPGGATLPLKILVASGTDHPGTNIGWSFADSCTGPFTWQGGGNNRWTKSACWSPSRSSAADLVTEDVLIFDGSVTPSPVVDEVPNQTNNAIHLTNGVVVTLTEPEALSATLELNGATGQDLDVAAGTLLTLAGSLPLTIELTASGHQGEVAGQILMKDGGHQLIGTNAGEITITGGVTIANSYSVTTHPFGSGTNGSVVFQSGSTGMFSSGLDPFGGVGHSVVTFNEGSTAHFLSAPAFFGDGASYGNLILDGESQSYFLAGSNQTTILNNFRLVTGNTFVLSSTPGADVNLFGNFRDETVLANQFQSNGRTIKFQGTTQTIFYAGALGTMSDVSIAQAPGGKVQLLSPTHITGRLNLTNADSLLELNGQSLQLDGTITGPGNLKGDPSANMVVLGPVALNLGTVNFVSGGRTLSSIQLNRVNGSMTLGTDLTLTGNLTLTDGILNSGANTLSLSPTSSVVRTNGYVTGNLQKSFGASGNLGSFTFPLGTANAYSPLDANVTANTNGTLTAKAVQGQEPNIPGGANALQRYWTLNGSGITANLTFHYSTSPTNDVVGNEANYKIFKYDGSFTQFTPDAMGVNSASDHFATVNNISSFSDWTLGEPTAVNSGTVAFVGAPYTTTEGNADHDVTITVARSGGSVGALDVTYATSAGTATAGTDYIETTSTLHWNDGESGNKTFVITVKGDSDYEPNETVNITLSNPTDGATITPPSATTLTITNDDSPGANATFTVNTTDDLDNGACLPAHCSLREAINAANALPDANTINIPGGDPGCPGGVCTINLNSALPDLISDMTINGSGAGTLTVQRSTAPATPEFRIFAIGNFTVAINGLTISNGKINDTSLSRGGGIFISNGSLTLTDVTVAGNSVGGPVSAKGGGIYNELGTLKITNSTISGNSAKAGGENDGGGIYNSSTLTIINSTVSGNSASDGITNVGGGIYSNGTSSLTNCTVANNSAGGSGLNQGGGINNVSGSMNARNTIISGNTSSTGPDFNGALTSLGHNVIGNTSGATVTPQTGDKFDANATPLNLGALQNNGGPTQTMALGSGSIAIDAGDDCVVDSAHCGDANLPQLTTDQRGTGFPRQVDGNNDGTAQVDIGAYEAPTCNPPATPTASNDGPYCEGATIQLSTDTVTGATYAWTGPNGFTSNQQKPSRANATVADGGTYSVIITVNGCTSATGTTNVVVNPAPAPPTASNGGPYCEGATISLSTPTVAGATYSWTGPNGFTSSAQNPTRANATTADAGTYSVTIAVNGCASAAGSTNVVVNATPATPTASNGGPYCEGATIQLSTPTVSGATYSWIGPNGFASSVQNPTRANATTADGGTYSVTVTVNGCTSAAGSTNVVVNATPATPTASNSGPYCEGSTIQLSTPTVSGATYSWTGPNGFTSSVQNPTRANATTADGGTYSVTVTVSGCSSAAGSTNVVVNATPATPTASNGGPYCEGATIQLSTPTVSGATYSWIGPNGFTSSVQNPTRANATTADGGTYSVTVTVNGCSSAAGSTNVVVNATPATPTASNGSPYCEGSTIQLSTPTVSGATYSWTGPNGFTSSVQNPTRANATTADGGTYSVTITVNGCASAAGSTNVVVNATPATPTASNDGPYCEGATIQLSTPTVSGATYSWTGPNGFISSVQKPTRANATTADAGTYSVTVTVSGCSSAAGTTNVVVNATPATPTASNGGPYIEGATIQLSTPTVSGATYSWTGPNGFTSSLQNPTRSNATPTDTGAYSVTITINGCTSAAGTTNVVVNTNAAPTVTDPGTLNLDPNSSAQFDIFANDADLGQNLSFSVAVGDVSCPDPPAGKFSSISFSGTTQLSVNPNNWKSVLTINSLAGSQGSYTQKIQVTDGVTPTMRCLNITVAAPDTDVVLSGGNLLISDTNGGNTDDAVALSLNGSNVRINDPNHVLSCSGGVSVNAHTCDIPLTSITGNIQFDGAGGSDTLTLALGGGNFLPQPGGVIYNGGDPTSAPGDQLIITGGNQGTVTYNYTNAHDGSVDMSNFGKVTYTGLEPISNSGTATDIVFELPAGPNSATLADDGTAGNAMSRLSAATFETTDFANPTGSLTIKRGDPADTLAVNALPDFTANFTIGSAGNEFSTVSFNDAIALAANNSLATNASGTINLSNGSNALTTSGTGTISLNAANVIGAGNVSTGGGLTISNTGSSSTLSGVIAGTGGLTKLGAGTLDLSGANTYTGATAVNSGRLNIDGSVDSNTTVNSGAALGGTGTINSANTLTVNDGVLAPGTSPGILNTGSVTFNSSSILAVEIGGTTPGNGPTNHDQLNVNGTVSLGNAVLGLFSLNGFAPSVGQTFVIISNDGTDGVTGTFNGLAEGATIPNFLGSSLNATITYHGGTNSNDVVLTTVAGPATHFLIGAPASATSSSAFSFTVTALDQFNNTATGYAGTVHFTSSDGAATLPANSTLTGGVGTFSATLNTAGNQTITATDAVTASITGASGTIAVSAGSATHFAVSAPVSATAGTAFSFTVTALDQFNNTATSYAGTVHFTSSDGSAVLPTNSTLISGTGTFSATLKTAGNQTLTATDTVTSSITGTSSTIAVSAGTATHFSVSAPASATAGTAFSFTVTALDQFNNTATGYAGTVHFTSSDGQAVLPANSTLTNGAGTFSATLKTAGNQTISATDVVTASITGTSSTIAVSVGLATHFSVSAPASATAGTAFSFTVTALDQFNNTATSYAGTVHFTSTDVGAVLPANSTLTNGTGTFSATLNTGGNQTITATDTVTSSITGTSNTILVGNQSMLVLDAKAAEPSSGTAEMLFAVTLSTPAAQTITVDYATAVGGANPATSGPCGIAGVDYQPTSGTLTFNIGDQIKIIPVTICADATNETDETLLLNLTNYSNLARAQATGTILASSQPGTVLISELRTSGPAGLGDDFVELYNNTDSPLIVAASDASAGYGVYKMGADCNAAPVLIATIPNGAVIPARGHYLLVGSQYSLADYGGPGAAAGDQALTSDIESDRNVAVFSTTNALAISSANRLDAVGFGANTGGFCDLLREGSTAPPVSGSTTQHSFSRDVCGKGGGPGGGVCPSQTPMDTNNNATDFIFADTLGTPISGVTQRLGAPGPENLTSPVLRNSTILANLLDQSVSATSPPNRVRDLTPNPANNSTNGTLSLRRRFTNNTGASVTRLRFRVIDISAFPSPGGTVADVRAISSADVVVGGINDAATCAPAAAPCTITINGTIVETSPAQPNGGGFNTSLAAGTITLGTPLANGASINVQFLLGVQQPGSFKFFVNVEALP